MSLLKKAFKNPAILALNLLFTFTCSQNSAFATENTHYGIVANEKNEIRKWKSLPIKLCPSEKLPKEFKSDLITAVEIWNSSFKKPLFKIHCDKKVDQFEAKDFSTHGIYWAVTGFDKLTSKTSLAHTIRQYDEDLNLIIDSDIIINGEYIHWSESKIDRQTVLLHELGHVLGLKHNFIQIDSAMNYYPYFSGYKHRSLGSYETTAINYAYFGDKQPIDDFLHFYFKGDLNRSLQLAKAKTTKPVYELSQLYRLSKNHEEAVKHFKLFLKKNPKNHLALTAIGDSYWSLKKVKEASEYFQKALAANINDYEASANLGALLANAGQGQAAKEFFENALRVNPLHYVSCFYLGQLTSDSKHLKCVEKYSPDPDLAKILKEQISKPNCDWCIAEDTKIAQEVSALAKLRPKELLKALREKGICIKVLDSKRTAPKAFFYWGKVEKASSPLTDVSQIKGLMGKTLCKNEHKLSEGCETIVLANDAPKSTLLHELMHIKQIEKDPKWCEVSKTLWGKTQISADTYQKIRNKEWDALQFLWINRNSLNLALEDLVTISSELLEEGKKRKEFDASAEAFLQEHQVQASFLKQIQVYKKQLGIK